MHGEVPEIVSQMRGGTTMPALTIDQAVETMSRAVRETFPADEVLEIYNEVFPSHPHPWEDLANGVEPLIQELVAYFKSGLSTSMIAELWSLLFTTHLDVYYNEEDDRLYYTEEAEATWTE